MDFIAPNDLLAVIEMDKRRSLGLPTTSSMSSSADETYCDQQNAPNHDLKKTLHAMTPVYRRSPHRLRNVPDVRDHDGGSGHVPVFPRSKESLTWTDLDHLSQSHDQLATSSRRQQLLVHSTKDTHQQQEPVHFDADDAYPEILQNEGNVGTRTQDVMLQGSSVDGPSYEPDDDDVYHDVDDDTDVSECGDDTVKIKFLAGKEKDRNSITVTNHKDLKKIVAKADWTKCRRSVRNKEERSSKYRADKRASCPKDSTVFVRLEHCSMFH